MRPRDLIEQMRREGLERRRALEAAGALEPAPPTLGDVERAARAGDEGARLPSDLEQLEPVRRAGELARGIVAAYERKALAIDELGAEAEARALPLIEAHGLRADSAARCAELYRLTVELGLEAAAAKGARAAPTEFCYMTTPEALSLVLGVSRRTVYRYLEALEAVGLVGRRARIGELIVGERDGGGLRTAAAEGTVLAVRLDGRPHSSGRAPVPPAPLLRAQWRDLVAAMRSGTLFRDLLHELRAELAHIKGLTEGDQGRRRLLRPFTVAPPSIEDHPENPLYVSTVENTRRERLSGAELGELLTLPELGLRDRTVAVGRLARRMAASLGETSCKPIAALLWRALYLEKSGRMAGAGMLAHIADAYDTARRRLERARAGKAARITRSAGALMHAILRRAGVLDELNRVPAYRAADRESETYVTLGIHPSKLAA